MVDASGFRDTRDEIVRILDGDTVLMPEEVYAGRASEADIYTHPGFSEYSGFLEKTVGLDRSDYGDYLNEITSSMQHSVEAGKPVAVLYPEEFQSETEEFLEEFIDPGEVTMIPTYSSTDGFGGLSTSSRPVRGSDESGVFSGKARYAGFINSLEDDGELKIYGELDDQCYRNAVWLAEKVVEKSGKEIDVVEDRSFPEKNFLPLPYRNVILPSAAGEKVSEAMQSIHTPPEKNL